VPVRTVTVERPLPARRTPDRVTARAPAKVNLHLSVGRRRPDGFHDLTTVFQAVGLYDDVAVERAGALTVEVTGEGADRVPADETNLAVRQSGSSRGTPAGPADVAIRISKGIPVAGGCAGGSADALPRWSAATRCGEPRCAHVLAELGAQLGSDVPSRCTAAPRSAPAAASS
jgi:4-diphosphocytidyl-2-C-methyl-D-erythritol kinase